jgi:fluoride exporter
MFKIILVGIGGFTGSIARYLFQLWVPHYPGAFPWGTFVVNILGSLVIGIIYGLAEEHKIMSHEFRLLLAIGFCGSFTTFSTFSAENLQMYQLESYGHLVVNVLLSVTLGIIAVVGGVQLTRYFI